MVFDALADMEKVLEFAFSTVPSVVEVDLAV